MNNLKKYRKVLPFLLATSLLLVACGGEPDKNEFELQLEENIAAVPERDPVAYQLVDDSRGELLLDEFGEPKVDSEGNPTNQRVGTLSKGIDRELQLSILTAEQLKELPTIDQVDIYLNGILRDEFYVAANLLYGEDGVKEQKEAFKKALMSPLKSEEGRIVDRIAIRSSMKNPNVAHHFVDDIILHLNRVYIEPAIIEDFGNRIVVSGETMPLSLLSGLSSIHSNAHEFVSLESKEYQRTEEDLKKLTDYYVESFVSALEDSKHLPNQYKETLGGFKEADNGLWYPADMERLASTVIELAYIR